MESNRLDVDQLRHYNVNTPNPLEDPHLTHHYLR